MESPQSLWAAPASAHLFSESIFLHSFTSVHPLYTQGLWASFFLHFLLQQYQPAGAAAAQAGHEAWGPPAEEQQ